MIPLETLNIKMCNSEKLGNLEAYPDTDIKAKSGNICQSDNEPLCEGNANPEPRHKSLFLNPLEILSKARISFKKSYLHLLKTKGDFMPFSIRHEKSFTAVSFAGHKFTVIHSFGKALERHQKRFSWIRAVARKRRAEIKRLKQDLAIANIQILELNGRRKAHWARRNNS